MLPRQRQSRWYLALRYKILPQHIKSDEVWLFFTFYYFLFVLHCCHVLGTNKWMSNILYCRWPRRYNKISKPAKIKSASYMESYSSFGIKGALLLQASIIHVKNIGMKGLVSLTILRTSKKTLPISCDSIADLSFYLFCHCSLWTNIQRCDLGESCKTSAIYCWTSCCHQERMEGKLSF